MFSTNRDQARVISHANAFSLKFFPHDGQQIDEFSDFVESISCETSKSCQVGGFHAGEPKKHTLIPLGLDSERWIQSWIRTPNGVAMFPRQSRR
jgi:hypothetical protein